ncbi:MAG TPA: hypothetical protein VF669_14165 [Tepidisphaeraceae bacterium]|jgi:hypothetical protein
MLAESAPVIISRLREFQTRVRTTLIHTRSEAALHEVSRSTAADTIYALDTHVEPIMETFFEEWGRQTPLVLVAEGLHDEHGNEGAVTFPRGTRESDAKLRIIVDPIDGTRGLMYDKRAAWSLVGVAPNKGAQTRLRDIQVAVMTELPTSKMGYADVLWASKNAGTQGVRVDLQMNREEPLKIQPSTAPGIDHGFASVSNFFPSTKVLSSELMEFLVSQLIGKADVTQATVFDDQYISTGGQFYELLIGHDRFNADLRPLFYRMQNQPEGLCCHPYDCATMLIAEEAGIILTDGLGKALDGPLDTTTGLSWAGFANRALHDNIQPLLTRFLKTHSPSPLAP